MNRKHLRATEAKEGTEQSCGLQRYYSSSRHSLKANNAWRGRLGNTHRGDLQHFLMTGTWSNLRWIQNIELDCLLGYRKVFCRGKRQIPTIKSHLNTSDAALFRLIPLLYNLASSALKPGELVTTTTTNLSQPSQGLTWDFLRQHKYLTSGQCRYSHPKVFMLSNIQSEFGDKQIFQ